MMYTTTPTTTINQINKLFKDFLWGFNMETGKWKTPLVAWNRLIQHREDASLGFKDYIAHVEALLCRWVARNMKDLHTEWVVSFMGRMKEFT